MIVLTVDQQGSRRVGDRVDGLLRDLGGLAVGADRADQAGAPGVAAGADGVVRPFERTVGDEVQAVLDDPAVAVDVVLALLRRGGWSVGVGVGPVVEPLPASSRAGSGPAFVLARTAVERAKVRGRVVPLAVEAHDGAAGEACEAVLTLLGALLARRSAAGWAAVDAARAAGPDATQEAVADMLGITQQAVSRRLRTALWSEELAVRPVAARLMAEGER